MGKWKRLITASGAARAPMLPTYSFIVRESCQQSLWSHVRESGDRAGIDENSDLSVDEATTDNRTINSQSCRQKFVWRVAKTTWKIIYLSLFPTCTKLLKKK